MDTKKLLQKAKVTKDKNRKGWFIVDLTDVINAIVSVSADDDYEAKAKAIKEVSDNPHMYGLSQNAEQIES